MFAGDSNPPLILGWLAKKSTPQATILINGGFKY